MRLNCPAPPGPQLPTERVPCCAGKPVNVDQHLSQVPPADLYVTVLGQLPTAELPLNDALEPGPLQIVRPTQSSGVGRSGRRRWKTRRGTRTTPLYSPISTPNSTACRSAFQWTARRSGCPMQPCSDPRFRLVLPNLEHAAGRPGQSPVTSPNGWGPTHPALCCP